MKSAVFLAMLALALLLCACSPGGGITSVNDAGKQTDDLKRSVEFVYRTDNVDADGVKVSHQLMLKLTHEPPSQ